MDNYGYESQGDYYYGNWNDFTLDDEKRARSRFSRLFLSLFLFTVISNAVAILAESGLLLLFGQDKAVEITSSYWYVWVLTVVSMYLIAFPIFFLMVRGMRKVERIPSDIKVSDILKLFFIAQAFTYVGNFVGSIFNAFFEAFTGAAPEYSVGDMVMSSPLWIVLLVTVLLAPIVEELMFRKLLIDRMSIYGDRIAIIVSSVAFGIFHGNFYQIFYATLIGFILGYIYVRTGNVIWSMVMHVAFNLWGSLVPWLLETSGVYAKYEEFLALYTSGEDFMASIEEYASAILYVGLYSSVQLSFVVLGIVFLVKRMRKTFISDRCEVLIPARRRAAIIIGNVGAILFLVAMALTMLMNIIAPLLTTATA